MKEQTMICTNVGRIKALMYASEMLSSQALIVPIKVLFFINFLMQNEDISLFRFFFVGAIFLFELPCGYLADKLGNKALFLVSKALVITSLVLNILIPSFIGFVVANAILGLSVAFDSGAGNSYMLMLSQKSNLDYTKIRVKLHKYSYFFNFLLMLSSSLLFGINVFLPHILTITLYIVSTILVAWMPRAEASDFEEEKDNEVNASFFVASRAVFCSFFNNKQLMLQTIFYALCASLLISNFDFYVVFFYAANIDTRFIGFIFSTFMLINILGVQIYDSGHKILSIALLVLLPFSFLLLLNNTVYMVLTAVFIQQLAFAYYGTNFRIFVLKSIKNLKTSSHFQATIDFVVASLRVIITLLVTLALHFIGLNGTFTLFAIATCAITILYLMLSSTIRDLLSGRLNDDST